MIRFLVYFIALLLIAWFCMAVTGHGDDLLDWRAITACAAAALVSVIALRQPRTR